jgi:hypothetical protein
MAVFWMSADIVVLQGMMMPQQVSQAFLFSLVSLGHRAFMYPAINPDEQRHADRCDHTLQNVVHG